MPSFPDTPEGRERRRKFNALRRDLYRTARGYGLGPRDAGHATSPATFHALLQRPFVPRSRLVAGEARGNWRPHLHSLRVRVKYSSTSGEAKTFFFTESTDIPGYYEGRSVSEILSPIRAQIERDYEVANIVSIDIVRQTDAEPLAP